MPEIREYVERRLPETYRVVTASGNYDGTNTKPDLVGLEIGVRMDLLFLPGTTEASLGEFSKGYVADVVAYQLITSFIDYVQWQTRKQDSSARPPGMEPGGGEQSTNYDRVQTLLSLSKELGNRIKDQLEDFTAINSAILRLNGARRTMAALISTDPRRGGLTDLVTPDAAEVFPLLDQVGDPSDPFLTRTGGFGVPVIIVPEQPLV